MEMVAHQKGFTLIEVIITAVIVAVLALIAVLVYNGYVNDARQQMLEGTAGDAAGFLVSAINLDATVPNNDLIPATLPSGGEWVVITPSGDSVRFQTPEGVELRIEGNEVRAYGAKHTSTPYTFR